MSALREAAQQALEALENTSPLGFNMESDKKFFATITALRAALAEEALQRLSDVNQEIEAALEQPEQRKQLTINEVEQILAQHNYEIHGDRARYIVRMTEEAHGIGEKK